MSPAVTPDGRFVLYSSSAENLVTNDFNGRPDVFVFDRVQDKTWLASVIPGNLRSANDASWPNGISSNGQFVVFQSHATDLVPDATNGWENIFLGDFATGTTSLVSVNTNGAAGRFSSLNPAMTPDGKWVVFESQADDLVANDGNQLADVFARDLVSGNTVLVSAAVSGSGAGAGSSFNPLIAPDGRFVVFESTAADLATNDFNTRNDIYLRDLVSGSTTLISVGNSGSAVGNAQNAVMSDDGRYVAFESVVGTVVAGDGDANLNDVFLRDVQSGTTTLISPLADFNVSTNVPNRPVISPDGRLVAFQTGGALNASVPATVGQIYAWDAPSGSNLLVSASLDGFSPAGGLSRHPVISADNRFITFISNATNLVANATNGSFQVYQRDLLSGVTTLVSVNRQGDGNNRDCLGLAASSDGRTIVFDSVEANFVPEDQNVAFDVFVRNISSNTTELISVAAPGFTSETPQGMSSSQPGSVSGDGRHVAFTSLAENLVGNDSNGRFDAFVRDLQSGTNVLVSVSTNGVSGSGNSRGVIISADGRYAAFISESGDLAPNVTNSGANLYLRDLQQSTTTLVTVNTNGYGSSGNLSAFSISADGRFLAYQTTGADLSALDANQTSDIYVFDRIGMTNLLVTVSTSGNSAAYGDSQNPIISRDGRFVAFESRATNLVPNSGSPKSGIYVHDLTSRTTSMLSRPTDIGSLGEGRQVFSADGRFLCYSDQTNVVICDLLSGARQSRSNRGGIGAISDNGRFIAFEKRLLVAPQSPVSSNTAVLVWDVQLDSEVLASPNLSNSGTGNGRSRTPVISADGRFVVFKSAADDLVPGDNNKVNDVFVRDLLLGKTLAVSLGAAGSGTGNLLSANPVMGADGRTVVFESFASDLIAGDFNQTKDVFLLRLGSADSDNDGMDDDWEVAFLENLTRNGAGDLDGDGASDLDEFKSGTNPANDASILRVITIESVVGGATSILWDAIPGRTYQVQYKSQFADSSWLNLAGTVLASATTGVLQDPDPATGDHRFYRVVLVTP